MKSARTLCAFLSFWIVFSAVLVPVAHAQAVFDVTAPVITVNEVKDGIAGETQVFTAEVSDDQGLKDVKLYIRYAGQQPYTSMTMERLGDTDFYSVNVGTDASETRTMEYYVQARDEGGNRVIKGFAFEPLLRALIPPGDSAEVAPAESAVQSAADVEVPVVETAAVTEEKPSAGKLKWWHIALGVLAIGALASAAGGGSDGGSSVEPGSVPVTITIEQP